MLLSSKISGQGVFEKGEYHSVNGKLKYRILFPDQFDENKKYPLLFFLHGSGERGSDNEKQLIHGSKLFLDSINRSAYPAIVVFPQCDVEDYWSNVEKARVGSKTQFNFKNGGDPTFAMTALIGLIDSLSAQAMVDKDRMYVGGLSMGGMGTFELLYRRPDTFAAAFPICGGGHPSTATDFSPKVKLWVFHGAKDDVVYPHHSTNMVIALMREGINPLYTLYKDANHNSWDSAFSESNLLNWIFSQSKN